MPLKMGIMKMNLFRGVKIGFIGLLVVSWSISVLWLHPEHDEHEGLVPVDDGHAERWEVPGARGDGGGEHAAPGQEWSAHPGARHCSCRHLLSLQTAKVIFLYKPVSICLNHRLILGKKLPFLGNICIFWGGFGEHFANWVGIFFIFHTLGI